MMLRKDLPILIYRGTEVCYNVLNAMAGQWERAFRRAGYEVLVYSEPEEGLNALLPYLDRDYAAVIGFQTYLYEIFLESRGHYLHEYLRGPKFNVLFDHPIWHRAHLEKLPPEVYVLTHDRNYKAFIEQHFPAVSGTFILPPAGCGEPLLRENPGQDSRSGIVFLGTYTDYRHFLPVIRKADRPIVRRVALRFLGLLHRNPELTAEAGMERALKECGVAYNAEVFLNWLELCTPVLYCIMSYYRERIVRAILSRGITLNVYGESWELLAGHLPKGEASKLNILPAVPYEENVKELAHYKLSLNVMAWHKDGYTERIINSMQQGAVVVSDESRYLKEHFTEGEMHLYDLKEPEALADWIAMALTEADERIGRMAASAARMAAAETWDARVKELEGLDL